MKQKDCSIEQRAWEDFKFAIFLSGTIAFPLGALVIIMQEWFPFTMLGFLFHVTVVFIIWRSKAKIFIKENIKP